MDTFLRIRVETDEEYRPGTYLSREDDWLKEWQTSLSRLTKLPEFLEMYTKSYWFEGAGGPAGPPLELIIALSGRQERFAQPS